MLPEPWGKVGRVRGYTAPVCPWTRIIGPLISAQPMTLRDDGCGAHFEGSASRKIEDVNCTNTVHDDGPPLRVLVRADARATESHAAMRIERAVFPQDGQQRATQHRTVQNLRHPSNAWVNIVDFERRNKRTRVFPRRRLTVTLTLIGRRRVFPLDSQLLAACVDVSVQFIARRRQGERKEPSCHESQHLLVREQLRRRR